MTNNFVRAERTAIQIGLLEIEGFMLPDASYRMSLTQAAQCVGKTAVGTFNFLRSKAFKRMVEEVGGTFNFLPESTITAIKEGSYTPDQFLIDIGEGGSKGETRIRGIPIELVNLYWHWESFRGNKQAFILVTGLSKESLERRFDSAFGINRPETEWNERLMQYTERLEGLLATLGDGLAFEDDILRENQYLRQVLKENGINPYALPTSDEEP